MICMDSDNNITMSQGDTLAVRFVIKPYKLQYGDRAIFSIALKGKTVLYAEIDDEGSEVLDFVIDKSDMKKLPSGKYLYDLYISFADGRRWTCDFTRELTIQPVAHLLDDESFGYGRPPKPPTNSHCHCCGG